MQQTGQAGIPAQARLADPQEEAGAQRAGQQQGQQVTQPPALEQQFGDQHQTEQIKYEVTRIEMREVGSQYPTPLTVGDGLALPGQRLQRAGPPVG